MVPVTDDVFGVAEGMVQVDSSTQRRTSDIYGSSQAWTAPINANGRGQTLKFDVSCGTNRIRLDTSALRLQFRFITPAGAAVAAGNFAPPWNLWARMIDSISLRFNKTTEVFKLNGGDYVHALTARMFREYTAETLNGMDNVFFTPATGDNHYIVGAGVAIADHVWDSAALANNYRGAAERSRRWIGENSHLKTVTKIIPFHVLFPPAICAAMKNIQSYQIDIAFIGTQVGNWVAHAAALDPAIVPGLLEQNAFGADADTQPLANINIINCDIITDHYVPSALLTVQQTAQKMPSADGESGTERVAYYDTQVINQTYARTGTMQLGAAQNLDAVCILDPCVSGTTTVTFYTNGQAAANRRVYTSSGQLFWGGSKAAAVAEYRHQADSQADGFDTLRMTYAGQQYPSREISTIVEGGTVCDFAALYQAYLRGVAKSSRTDITAAVPFSAFRTTMPFAFLRPWADNAPHLNNITTDCTIILPGGVADVQRIFVVIFQVAMIEIRSDGHVGQLHSLS